MKLLYAGLICLLLAVPCAARIITVDDDGPADFNNIQAAIDDANNGDTVIVADGRYTGPDNRDIDFKGKAITVRSKDPNDPNIVVTTIIDCNGTEEEPHRGFYFDSGEGSDSVLEGFTITNGGYGYVNGGGVYCENSSPMITNCNIIGNVSYSFSTCGGVYAGRGGGIYCEHSNATISNCSIIGNTAGFVGAGICCFSSDPVINNCTISSNKSGIDGGGLYCYESKPRLNNCTISSNSAGTNGGGVCCDYYSDSHPTINNCTISSNTAALRGGGIYSKNLTLTNSKISGNSATSMSGGAMFFCWESAQIVRNCVISGNTARYSGGIECLGSNTKLYNCTIVGNRSGLGGCIISYSGHLNTNPDPVISNCIFWSNGSLKPPAAIEIDNNSNHPVYLTISYSDLQSGEPAVYVHSDGFGHPLTWGDGNSDVDPCFVEPGYWDANGTPEDANDDFWVDGDYHLKSQAGRCDGKNQSWVKDDVTSPCIDAGDSMSPIGQEPFPNGGIINMGTYGGTAEASKSYFGEPICEVIIAGDINGDCKVDWADFTLMARHWLEESR